MTKLGIYVDSQYRLVEPQEDVAYIISTFTCITIQTNFIHLLSTGKSTTHVLSGAQI